MRDHYMREYTHCMTRMMEATPDCHQMDMRSMYQANWELMYMFNEDQCQMNQDGEKSYSWTYWKHISDICIILLLVMPIDAASSFDKN